MSLKKIAQVMNYYNNEYHLEKQAIPGLATMAAAHVGQNIVLKGMLKNKNIIPNILENRLTQQPDVLHSIKDGASNVVLPELGILENEARHSFNTIRDKGMKDKAYAVNFLKGNWARMAQSEQGRKALAEHLSQYSPVAAKMINHLPQETIQALENTYKNDELGQNIINSTKKLSKLRTVTETPKKFKAFRRATELGGNMMVGSEEHLLPVLNIGKRVGATDLSALSNKKIVKNNKFAKKLLGGAQKAQDKMKEVFVKNPLNTSAENNLSSNKFTLAKDKVMRAVQTYGGNAIVGGARDLDSKLVGVIRQKHPALADGIKQQLAQNKGSNISSTKDLFKFN